MELTHPKEKGFFCHLCDASFSFQLRLLRHVESVHEGKDVSVHDGKNNDTSVDSEIIEDQLEGEWKQFDILIYLHEILIFSFKVYI